MSPPKKKSPVSIVCPHCQRSYVIQVDLQRIFRTSPRAICARCGKRFDVIQRMSEIEPGNVEADQATDQRSADVPRPPRARVDHAPPTRDRAAADRPKRPRAAPGPGPGPVKSERGDEDLPAARQPARAAPAPDDLPPLPMLVSEDREQAPRADPAQASSPPAREEASPSAALVGASLAPSGPSGDAGAPARSDLARPLPWIDQAGAPLALEGPPLPESAAALEGLLAERPRRPG
jgi:hypothetical protein